MEGGRRGAVRRGLAPETSAFALLHRRPDETPGPLMLRSSCSCKLLVQRGTFLERLYVSLAAVGGLLLILSMLGGLLKERTFVSEPERRTRSTGTFYEKSPSKAMLMPHAVPRRVKR